MTLAPKDESLRAVALVRNGDSAFVREGQRVTVKLVASPFHKYGMLEGTVVRLGRMRAKCAVRRTISRQGARSPMGSPRPGRRTASPGATCRGFS
jgi:hypothetical protein